MNAFTDNLYYAWAIAVKDIGDALKNRNTRTNILVTLGLVVFFYWTSTARPWDQHLEVVVYDEGDNGLTSLPTNLTGGFEFVFSEAASLEEMENEMRYEQLGVIVPVDFQAVLASGGEPTLSGYILWVFRDQTAELEAVYTEKFSELLGQPVRVEIDENIVIPSPGVRTNIVNIHVLLITLLMALYLVPALMLEEKQTRTLDALLVSPTSAGQVVAGKALAGLFYVLLGGGLFFVLNRAYITNWGLALLVFLGCAVFCVGLGLALGGLVRTPQQMTIWMFPIVILLIVPTALIYLSLLAPGLETIFSWLPSTALAELFQFTMSSRAPLDRLLIDLAIVVVSCGLVYGVVIWQVGRTE